MGEVWQALGVALEIVATLFLGLILFAFGLWVALAALIGAVVALPVAAVIAAAGDMVFIDALAWCWTIATVAGLIPSTMLMRSADAWIAAILD